MDMKPRNFCSHWNDDKNNSIILLIIFLVPSFFTFRAGSWRKNNSGGPNIFKGPWRAKTVTSDVSLNRAMLGRKGTWKILNWVPSTSYHGKPEDMIRVLWTEKRRWLEKMIILTNGDSMLQTSP